MNILNYQKTIQATFKEAESFGKIILQNGAMLVGHVPHVAPEAYLHIKFPGLKTEELKEIEVLIDRKLPVSLSDFYRTSNGLDLFSCSLAVHGLRRISMDDAEQNIWLPFCIVVMNTLERVPDAPKDAVFFASYEWDGSLLYMTPSSNTVTRCSRDSITPLNEWSSLDDALVSEISRLSVLYDSKGKLIDPDCPTIPAISS